MIKSAQLTLLPYFFLIGQSRRLALSRLVLSGQELSGAKRCYRCPTSAAVRDPVGAGSMPGHTDHQTTVVPPVGRPPFLAVGHQIVHVLFQGINVQLFQLFVIVKIFT
jgi:hypothetical protein